uniref:(northern house mosquito) hypothetical protein n=1 Tax=Culex pipiens TaxID=7175 RepID=A0A8D8KY59_CULPI
MFGAKIKSNNTHADITPPNTTVSCIITRKKKHNKEGEVEKKYFFDTQIGQTPAPGMVAKFQAFDVCGKKKPNSSHTSLGAKKTLKRENRLEHGKLCICTYLVETLLHC